MAPAAVTAGVNVLFGLYLIAHAVRRGRRKAHLSVGLLLRVSAAGLVWLAALVAESEPGELPSLPAQQV